jgi:signal transduction histidine kinase
MTPRSLTVPDRGRCEHAAEVLGRAAFLSVPLRRQAQTVGRLYVAADHPVFDAADLDFLQQAADQIMPAVAHVELIERMATRAAADERERIALDIHDRLIQPYIGLQVAVRAVEELTVELPDTEAARKVHERVQQLNALSALGIADLRGYVRGLRVGHMPAGRLSESLGRFAERFEEATGIVVALEIEADIELDDRLAGEIFSMVNEAVSNVRRHTHARSAAIRLARLREHLVLCVENALDPNESDRTFIPQSIVDRAAAVNGTTKVESTPHGTTAVTVEIPL